jgi:hypothetical protein
MAIGIWFVAFSGATIASFYGAKINIAHAIIAANLAVGFWYLLLMGVQRR